MTLTVQQLGQQAAFMEKVSSTALVRMIRKGLLSPKSIRRASQAMEPGKFRYLKHLGEGSSSTADLVVGNVFGQQGKMVRKVPTKYHWDPRKYYAGEMQSVEDINKLAPRPAGHAPTAAPIFGVNRHGMFQHYSTAADKVPDSIIRQLEAVMTPERGSIYQGGLRKIPEMKRFWDIMPPRNRGPGGQIIDFKDNLRRMTRGERDAYLATRSKRYHKETGTHPPQHPDTTEAIHMEEHTEVPKRILNHPKRPSQYVDRRAYGPDVPNPHAEEQIANQRDPGLPADYLDATPHYRTFNSGGMMPSLDYQHARAVKRHNEMRWFNATQARTERAREVRKLWGHSRRKAHGPSWQSSWVLPDELAAQTYAMGQLAQAPKLRALDKLKKLLGLKTPSKYDVFGNHPKARRWKDPDFQKYHEQDLADIRRDRAFFEQAVQAGTSLPSNTLGAQMLRDGGFRNIMLGPASSRWFKGATRT